jgi:hypothetical protein
VENLRIGEKDGKVVKSPWLPYAQMAGTGDSWKIPRSTAND